MITPDLFVEPPPKPATPPPRARNTDPATSHRAAARMAGKPCQNHYALILGVLWRPMTGKEIAKLTGLTNEQVCRRLPELLDGGEVRLTGEEREGSRVWAKMLDSDRKSAAK